MKLFARRTTRLLAYGLAGLVALFAVAHAPFVKRVVRSLVVAKLEDLAGGILSIEDLDYRLWRGELRGTNISWTSESTSAHVREALFELSLDGLSMRVDSPDIRLTPLETSGGDSAGPPVALPEALLGVRVTVVDGKFSLADDLELTSIRAELEPSGPVSRGRVEVGSVRVRLGERDARLGPAGARFRLTPTSLQLDEARLEKESSRVEASGSLGPLSPLEGQLRFDVRIDSSTLRELDARLDLQGIIEGTGSLAREPGSPWTATGTLRSDALLFDGQGPVAVEAPFRLDGSTIALTKAELRGYGGTVVADAGLDLAADAQRIEASFEGLDVRAFVPRVASRASGTIALWTQGFDFDSATAEGRLDLRSTPSRDPRAVALGGNVRLRLESGRIGFEAARLVAPNLEIAASGGFGDVLSVDYRVRASDLENAGRLFALAGLDPPPVPLRGSVVLQGKLTGAATEPALAGSVASEAFRIGGIGFDLAGGFAWSRSRLELQDIRLRSEEGSYLVLHGVVPTEESAGAFSLAARAEALDLAWASPVALLPLEGRVTGALDLSGAFSRPDVRLSFEASDVVAGDVARGNVRGEARLRGPVQTLAGDARIRLDALSVRGVELPDTTFTLGSDGETARVEGRFADGRELIAARLRLDPPYELEGGVPLQNLPFAEARELFPSLVEGDAQLEVEGRALFTASLLDPGSLRYRVDTERVLGFYRGLVLGATAPFVIEGDLSQLEVRDLTLVGEDTAIGIEGVLPLSRDGGVLLQAQGATRLELLRPWLPEFDLAGYANVEIRLEGALPDPWLRGEITIEEASARFASVRLENVLAFASWTDEALEIEELSGEVLGGKFRIRGALLPSSLRARAPARLRFEVQDVDPLRLFPAESEWLSGNEIRLGVTGELEGESLDPAAWSGRGNVERIVGRATAFQFDNVDPAPWLLDEGSIRLSGLELSGGATRLAIDAEARPFDELLSWTARATGRLDHSIASVALQELGWSLTGATDLDVRAGSGGGDEEAFFVEGRGSFENARLVIRDPSIAFTNLAGEVELTGNRIVLTRLGADAGGGAVEAQGEIALAGDGLGSIDLSARARSVRLNYPEGLRSEVDGDFRLSGTNELMKLSGEVTLARALFSRDINVETELLQSLSRVSGPSASSPFASSVEVDLRVRAAEAFRIDNNLARMEASVNLNVSGTLDAPEITGIASARPGGRFRFGGNTYRIETGRIQLREYPREPPDLDITARTSVSPYDIQLRLRGSTDDLVTELTSPSHPELSRGDVASLLLTGRTLNEISSAGRAVVGERMVSYLGATLADLAQLGIGETLPFDIITVEPALIAGETDPGARFTLGARFNDALSFVYSIGLNNAEDQIWVIDYELPRRTRTQIIRRENNEFTFGLSQELRFDVRRRERDRSVPRPTVSQVDVTFTLPGRAPEPVEAAVRKELRTKPGDEYDYWSAWEEAERLRSELRKNDYLEASVDMRTSQAQGGLGLEYVVDVGPRASFVWEGDEPDSSLKKALAEAWTGASSEAFLTGDLALIAEGRLFEKGYYIAATEVEARRSDGELVITVSLQSGPRGKGVVVDFTGSDSMDDSDLLTTLPKPSSAEFHELVTSKRARLKQLLALLYASRGFVRATIGDPELAFDEATRELRVSIPIDEGLRFRVAEVELEGVESVDEAELRSRLSLRAGEPFRVTGFVEDRSTVASYYRDRGFPDVHVESTVVDRPADGVLGVRLVVREGPPVTVGAVAVAGNETTRESVIRREVALEPGAPLRLSQVSETQRKLYELGVFQSADVVVEEPASGASSRNVRVEVSEAPDLDFDYGARVSTEGFFEALGDLRAPNLFGRAQGASVRALVGSDRRIFRFTYHTPYLVRYRIGTDFFVERAFEFEGPQPIEGDPTRETFAFTDRTWTFTAQQTRILSRQVNLQWSYSFRRVVTEIDDPEDFLDVVLPQNRALLTTSIIGDYRDSVLRPSRGSLWSVTLQGAPESLGSDLTFLKLFGQLYTFVPLGKNVVWAAGYRVGATNSFGQRLAEDDRFQAGGPNSVRGFRQGSLGPIDKDLLIALGGAGLLVFNQEIRFPLFWRLLGVGFYDAGNAFETVSEMRLSDLRQSVGTGLRLELPFGLLRLDWAHLLDRREGEGRWRFIFSLGHAF